MCDVGVLIGRIVTFVNLCDRGHRAKGAWLAGKEAMRDSETVQRSTLQLVLTINRAMNGR